MRPKRERRYTDFLRVTDVLAAFPDPTSVSNNRIAEHFGCCDEIAIEVRVLAAKRAAADALIARFGLSRSEAEASVEAQGLVSA